MVRDECAASCTFVAARSPVATRRVLLPSPQWHSGARIDHGSQASSRVTPLASALAPAGTSGSTILGVGAGESLVVGSRNTFVGSGAGRNYASSSDNVIVGYQAGVTLEQASTSAANVFIGTRAGLFSTGGGSNTMVGHGTGALANGSANTVVGSGAGHSTSGINNVAIGVNAGVQTNGWWNRFVGHGARITPASDLFTGGVTLIGNDAIASPGLRNATAIGTNAEVTQSDSLVLGSAAGFQTPTRVGIGVTAPQARLHVMGGRIYVDSPGQGVILQSAGANCFEVRVSDAGELTTTATACP